MNWFNVRREGEAATIGIFGEIGNYFSNQTAEDLAREIEGATKIELFIDSNGGGSETAFQVFDLLAGRNVTATITGRCHSAAVIVAFAAKEITIYSTGRMMVHSAISYFIGSPAQLRKEADDLEKLVLRMAALICERTGDPPATVATWLDGSKDFYFSPDEAVAIGLADAVIEPPPLPSIARQAELPADAPGGIRESERLFNDWLRAFGKVEVSNRQQFFQELHFWAVQNVKQVDCHSLTPHTFPPL